MESRRRKYRGAAAGGGKPPSPPHGVQDLVEQPKPAAMAISSVAAAPSPQPVHEAANEAGLRWVKLERYCVLAGDTPAAVHARLHQGKWKTGTHVKKAGGVLWVCLDAVDAWIESQ